MRRLVLISSLLMVGCGATHGGPDSRATTPPPGSSGVRHGRSVLHRPSRQKTRAGATLGLGPTTQPAIRRACRKAAKAAAATVYCPPLTPLGPAQVLGVNGLRRARDFRDGLILNFASRSVNSSTQPGHWSYAQGRPAALVLLLRSADHDPPIAAPVMSDTAIGDVPVTVDLMPSFRVFHGVYGGHVVVAWTCRGTAYQLSMHGHGNRARTLAMADAVIAEMLPCRR
jgi:hypothetical protein